MFKKPSVSLAAQSDQLLRCAGLAESWSLFLRRAASPSAKLHRYRRLDVCALWHSAETRGKCPNLLETAQQPLERFSASGSAGVSGIPGRLCLLEPNRHSAAVGGSWSGDGETPRFGSPLGWEWAGVGRRGVCRAAGRWEDGGAAQLLQRQVVSPVSYSTFSPSEKLNSIFSLKKKKRKVFCESWRR